MKVNSPKPQPKRTTVELTRREVCEAIRTYVEKESTTILPDGIHNIMILSNEKIHDQKYHVMSSNDKLVFIIEEPAE